MRAAWYHRTGPAAEVLTIGELADPEPGPGEVRVRVNPVLRASCVKKARCARRRG